MLLNRFHLQVAFRIWKTREGVRESKQAMNCQGYRRSPFGNGHSPPPREQRMGIRYGKAAGRAAVGVTAVL
jgi:hypothetical protein